MLLKNITNNIGDQGLVSFKYDNTSVNIDLNTVTGRTDLIATYCAVDPTSQLLYVAAKKFIPNITTTPNLLFIFDIKSNQLVYFMGDI